MQIRTKSLWKTHPRGHVITTYGEISDTKLRIFSKHSAQRRFSYQTPRSWATFVKRYDISILTTKYASVYLATAGADEIRESVRTYGNRAFLVSKSTAVITAKWHTWRTRIPRLETKR